MKPLLRVVADDLTGACEIAALGYRRNLRSVVAVTTDGETRDADLVVVDTDSRLDDDWRAEEKVIAAGLNLPVGPAVRLFKKTDSVLRGPVGAEVAALARARGCPRVLLLAGNPQLGRTITGGCYRIDDRPLEETEFANDPHHPAKGSDVRGLIRTVDGQPVVVAARGDALPDRGVIVGDVAKVDDFRAWLTALDEDTLPAGGAAFFDVLLDHWRVPSASRSSDPLPDGPQLIVSGTLSPAQRQQIEAAGAAGVVLEGPAGGARGLSEAGVRRWADRVAAHLSTGKPVVAWVPFGRAAQDPSAVRSALASLCAALVADGALQHVVIEGGSTAATISRRLGWTRLEVVFDWGGGTVTLAPASANGCTLTLKPGSYPWPETLADRIFSPGTLSTAR